MVSKWDNLSNELETMIIQNPDFFQHEGFFNKQNPSSLKVFKGKKLSGLNALVSEKGHDSKSVQCYIQSSTEVSSSNSNENNQTVGVTKEQSNTKFNSRNRSKNSKKRAKFINDLSSKSSNDVDTNSLKAAFVIKGVVKKSSSLNSSLNSNLPNKSRYNNNGKSLERLPRFKGDENYLKDLPKKLIELEILDKTDNLNKFNIGQGKSQNKKHKEAVIDYLKNQRVVSVQQATEVLKENTKFFKNKNKNEASAPTVTPVHSDQNSADKLELEAPHTPINIKSSTASVVEDRGKNIPNFKDTTFNGTIEIGDEPKIVETYAPFDKVKPREYVKTEKNETLLGDLHNKSLVLVDQSDENQKKVDRNLLKDYQEAKKENESLKV